jgi:hypothetical protein
MGYFDALTTSYFKTAADGRKPFFPCGVLGRGYFLGSERDYEQLRRRLKTYTILALVATAGSTALQIPIAAIVTPTLLIAFYSLWVSCRLRGRLCVHARPSEPASRTLTCLAHCRSSNPRSHPALFAAASYVLCAKSSSASSGDTAARTAS